MTDLPWWRTDEFNDETPVPSAFNYYCGPLGPALVRAWPSGVTDPGWGGEQFMDRYHKHEFNRRRVLIGYERKRHAFAFVMRSVRLVCIDIDGKNGGLEHAKRLGALPPTLAETSKSGNGYHLFYRTEEDWDVDKGYALYDDRIGLEQGVDFRGTGCVYHHKGQHWNQRAPRLLPDHLGEVLLHKSQKAAATTARIEKVLEGQDELEVLMLHDEIMRDLAKPIPQGKRNTTLFAIGSQMKTAGVPDWDNKLAVRANEVGVSAEEANKIIANVDKYAVAP